MIDPKVQAGLDQDISLFSETFPRLWRALYKNLLAEGFSESQALALVQTYILASVGGHK